MLPEDFVGLTQCVSWDVKKVLVISLILTNQSVTEPKYILKIFRSNRASTKTSEGLKNG